LPEHFAITLGLVLALSALAALPPAARAARIEASEVIRDV
jgi:putative ABC transport system permease protein